LGNAAGAGADDAPLCRNRSCQAHQAARDKRDRAAVPKPIIVVAAVAYSVLIVWEAVKSA
jgi:hypothetical protein